MESESGRARPWLLPCAPLFALLACAALFLWRDVGLHMADEGFLWYGVQRTLAGEVPLRDFQSYDPGRYYWCAALAPLLGDGILGVRTATALFAAVGLTLALLVAGRFARHPLELLLVALILGLWLFPRHKLYEPALASAALWFAVRLVESPTLARHLAAGAFVGCAAFFGRNHALYSGLALGSCVLFLAWKRAELRGPRPAGAFALGVALGTLPLVGMLVLVPGFFTGYVDSLRLVLAHGANLPRPYPFPWRTEWAGLSTLELGTALALAVDFLLPFVVLPIGLWSALRASAGDLRSRAVPIAALSVAAFYLHHVSVRSDDTHLAQCIPPLLVLALSLSARHRSELARTLVWSALLVLSALTALGSNSLVTRFRRAAEKELVPHDVAGELLRLPSTQAAYLGRLEDFVLANLPGAEPLWIVNRPMLYPVLGKSAPTWWLHFYWPADEEEQRALIRRLDERGVAWALVVTGDPEEGERQGFPKTHPLVWRHLNEVFQPVSVPKLPQGTQIFRRRS